MSPEQIAIASLREYLLAKIPARLAALNLERAAVLKSALVGPFVFPADAVLKISPSRSGSITSIPLLSGSTQSVVDAINGATPAGLLATPDDDGRIVLTAAALPAAGAPSVVSVRADETGANGAFGWSAGGEHVMRVDVRAPNWRNVIDGAWPAQIPESNERGFVVALGDRQARPWPTAPNLRRDEWTITIATDVLWPFASDMPSADREAISTCVRAVREVLLTTEGRQLGRAGKGDVMLADVPLARIAPVSFNAPGSIRFDVASLTITVRVFQRPD